MIVSTTKRKDENTWKEEQEQKKIGKNSIDKVKSHIHTTYTDIFIIL